MGFNFDGQQVNLSTSVTTTVPVPDSNQTIVNVEETGTGSTEDAYTVPAGKTFYLTQFWARGDTDQDWQVFLNDGSTRVLLVNTATGISSHIVSSIPLATYTAEQVVKIEGPSGKLCGFSGVLQTN